MILTQFFASLSESTDNVEPGSEELVIVREFIAFPAPNRGQIFWEMTRNSNPNPVSAPPRKD
jgi:hypothetical protein